MPQTYTVHLQKYPYPGARYGIQQLINRLSGGKDIIRLLGNPKGFENEIESLKNSEIQFLNETNQ